jgi:hypothetical protein
MNPTMIRANHATINKLMPFLREDDLKASEL